jgi:hypothetical protein
MKAVFALALISASLLSTAARAESVEFQSPVRSCLAAKDKFSLSKTDGGFVVTLNGCARMIDAMNADSGSVDFAIDRKGNIHIELHSFLERSPDSPMEADFALPKYPENGVFSDREASRRYASAALTLLQILDDADKALGDTPLTFNVIGQLAEERKLAFEIRTLLPEKVELDYWLN